MDLYETVEKINPRFIYFDLGGVVFNFSKGLRNLSEKINAPFHEVIQLWKQYDENICTGEINPQQFWNILTAKFRYNGDNINFLDFWAGSFEPIEYTHKVIKWLVKKNRNIGIISNIYPGILKRAIKSGAIPRVGFNAIIQSCEIGIIKPDPDILLNKKLIAKEMKFY